MEIFHSGLSMPRLAVYTGLDGAMLFKFFYVEVGRSYGESKYIKKCSGGANIETQYTYGVARACKGRWLSVCWVIGFHMHPVHMLPAHIVFDKNHILPGLVPECPKSRLREQVLDWRALLASEPPALRHGAAERKRLQRRLVCTRAAT